MFYDLFEDDVLADDCANVVPDLSRLLSDDELTEILPEGSPYAEAVILDGEELTPDMALIIASLNWETMMRNTAAYLATIGIITLLIPTASMATTIVSVRLSSWPTPCSCWQGREASKLRLPWLRCGTCPAWFLTL